MSRNYSLFVSYVLLVALSVSILSLGCAEVAPPPGGEQDKSSPYIIATTPTNGQLLTPKSDQIFIQFSERLVEPENGQSIFISPKQSSEPKIDWKSDAIVITLADSFSTNSTYIISFSSDIKDLRGNRLDSNLTIAFTTGNKLASGSVSGFVFAENTPQAGMMVGLYDSEMIDSTSRIDSLSPDYIAYTNNSGFFKFKFLPKKRFHILAFKDKDKDNHFDLYRESFAVPDRLIDLTNKLSIDSLYLPLNKLDTTTTKISSVYYDENSLLKIKLNKEIEIADYLFGIYITSNDTTESSVFGNKAIALGDLGQQYSSLLITYIPDLKDDDYYVILKNLDKPNMADLTFNDFKLVSKVDKETPKIVSLTPDTLTQLSNNFDIVITFTEAIDTSKLTAETFSLYQDSLTKINITQKNLNDFQVSFSSDKLQYGQDYQFRIVEFDIVDNAGNLLGDSLRTFTIKIASRDSLGTISGDVIVVDSSKADYQVILIAENHKTKQIEYLKLTDNRFSKELLPGKYKLTAFIDSDANGKRSLGNAFPYALSETFAVYPDTVKVRPRFEVAEIKFDIR